jgi:hypothetical protein
MAFRFINKENRKAALLACMNGIDVNYIRQVAKQYDIDYRTLQSDCYDIVEEIDYMLDKKSLIGRLKKNLKRILWKIKL